MKTNAINENEDIKTEELLFTVGGRINGTITKLIRNISTISQKLEDEKSLDIYKLIN